jgi:glucan 1,3-beta-glucosidase
VNPPTILVASNYTKGGAIIGEAAFDANIYIPGFGGSGLTWWDNQNNFYRQIRNFNFDLTQAPNDTAAIHWQVAQATGLQNIRINMRAKNTPGNRQVGINMENGSGGWFSDITINGGMLGMSLGSQQFTSRRITINGAMTAIKFVFDWIWLFAQMEIVNCDIGFDMSNGGFANQATSQVMIVDSIISATLGILSVYAPGYSSPQAAGSLMVERVDFTNSATAIAVGTDASSRLILAGRQFVPLFAQGNAWTSAGQELNGQIFNGTSCTFQNKSQTVKTAREFTIQRQLAPIARPASLVDSQGNWLGRARPQYENLEPSDFLSARQFGLLGNGITGNGFATCLISHADS